MAIPRTLSSWQRTGLVLLAVSYLVLGVVVEIRSAFLKRRMTDLDVYLRAAWAVRTGNDIYTVVDTNAWHYHYPPLLAIALVPLADPPPDADRDGMIPFAVSVGIFYVLNLICLALALNTLATAVEESIAARDHTGQDAPPTARRWLILRCWPLLACLVPIGHTLMRGQVNVLLLMLLCCFAAAILRGRNGQAGWWLAAAICLKIIPAMLLVYPLWRRNFRCLAGCAAGLVVGLVIVPSLVFGPARTVAYYREWDEQLRQPALADGADQSRARELIDITATDSQSLLAMLHNGLNPDRATRPPRPTDLVRMLHWLIGGTLVGLTLLAAGLRQRQGPGELAVLGCLMILMILMSPVCHLHYFCIAVPLVMAILGHQMGRPPNLWAQVGWWLLFVVNLVADTLPNLPGQEFVRDHGLASYAALLLWSVGIYLSRRAAPPSAVPLTEQPIRLARCA